MNSRVVKKAALVLLAVLAVVSTVATGFGLLAAAVWGTVAFCWFQVRRIRRHVPPQRLREHGGLCYNLCAFGLLYLIPLGAAATFYCLLSLYLKLFGGMVGVGSLVLLQQTFESASKFFADNLKLSELTVFGGLVGVYLLTFLLLLKARAAGSAAKNGRGWRLRAASALNRGAVSYTVYSGPVAAGLATLASFTVFGMQLGVPANDLQPRLKIAQQGYAVATKKIEANLSERVAHDLYDKIQAQLPAEYRVALDRQEKIGALAGVSGLSAQEAASRASVDALDPNLRIIATGRTDLRGAGSPRQIEAAGAALADRPYGQQISLVTDGRKRVVLQVEKIASEQEQTDVTRQVAAAGRSQQLAQSVEQRVSGLENEKKVADDLRSRNERTRKLVLPQLGTLVDPDTMEMLRWSRQTAREAERSRGMDPLSPRPPAGTWNPSEYHQRQPYDHVESRGYAPRPTGQVPKVGKAPVRIPFF